MFLHVEALKLQCILLEMKSKILVCSPLPLTQAYYALIQILGQRASTLVGKLPQHGNLINNATSNAQDKSPGSAAVLVFLFAVTWKNIPLHHHGEKTYTF